MQDAVRNNITWVLLTDVDEYVHVVHAEKTLKDLVEPFKDDESVGAVSMRNMFYGIGSSDLSVFDTSKPQMTLRDYVYRHHHAEAPNARSKMLVRPGNVDYLSVHKVTVGNETVHMDPEDEVRINHYKHKGKCIRPVKDTRLRDEFAERLEARLEHMFQPNKTSYPEEIKDKCPEPHYHPPKKSSTLRFSES